MVITFMVFITFMGDTAEVMKNDAVGVQVNAQSQENEPTPAIIQGMPNPLDGNNQEYGNPLQDVAAH